MTQDLYLIAHKVRGVLAFDIAEHMTCPKCEGTDDHCTQCDGAGHWWIIPTSGHRAFPATFMHLDCVTPAHVAMMAQSDVSAVRDHYTTVREAAIDLTRVLGLIHKPLAPLPPLKRRL